MPIPALTADGLLPEGVHDCTLEEIRDRFGRFQRTDARCRLFERLEAYVRQAKASGVVVAVILDGSFVTDEAVPNDIDLVVVALPKDRLPVTLRPAVYNVLSKRSVRREYGFDVLLAQESEADVQEHIEFFSQVRERPEIRKGLLRIWL